MKRRIIICAIAVAVLATAAILLLPKKSSEGEVKWITTTVESSHIVQSITATGTIEPVTQVDIGTQVSGILTNLYVDYNSVVTKGQVIAELDKSTLLLDRNSNRNNVAIAQSKLNYEKSNFERVEALFNKSLIAQADYDLALYTFETAKNDLEVAKNDLARSETNLGYATIYSPIDGVVISRSVEEGQTVASSFSTPTLFTVAADLKDMRVIVDVDEADIGNVTTGQRATFTVDAFPLDTFEGVVTQVRQEAIVESNVTTYEVVISAANPDLKLKPGLTASVEVFTLDVACEKAVSAAALAFTPPMPADAPDMPSHGALKGDAPKGSVVWVLSDNHPTPCPVSVGESNGILTEIIGDVAVGAQVITGVDSSMPMGAGGPPSSGESNPFLPQHPGQKRK